MKFMEHIGWLLLDFWYAQALGFACWITYEMALGLLEDLRSTKQGRGRRNDHRAP